MVVVTSERRVDAVDSVHEPLDPDLRRCILETVELVDRRGYGVPLADFSRNLYGGARDPGTVAAAIAAMPELTIEGGLVLHPDRKGDVSRIAARQASHGDHAPGAAALAADFAGRLVSSCPFVKSVSLTGSMASAGFDPRDDIDMNIVAADGTKYIVYLWSLALAAVTSLRNRHKETDEMGALPFLPKIICVNVVWEERQVRPLVRQDKWIAYELFMHRPILGRGVWENVLAENAWLARHFPQVGQPDFLPDDDPAAVAKTTVPRPGRAFFSSLARHPAALRLAEGASRFFVIAAHRLVSLMRTRTPAAREREQFVNLVKRPYSVYDVPGREQAVPTAALQPR